MTNSLREAVILAVLILFLLLQNWKATLVPAIAIPVALIGTFALVLATGFVVDDAITAVEDTSAKKAEGITSVQAAKYESYSDAIIILLTVSTALLGALVFLGGAGQVLNIYAQVGLVMRIGLAGGNAILIVDLANQKMCEGGSALDAAKFSAKSRLRPILMTAISSLTGFLPLMLASGVGSQRQSSLGLVVFGGLLVATFLSTLVVPVFYVVIKSLLGQADAKPQY